MAYVGEYTSPIDHLGWVFSDTPTLTGAFLQKPSPCPEGRAWTHGIFTKQIAYQFTKKTTHH